MAKPKATNRVQATSLTGIYDARQSVPSPELTPPKEHDKPESYVPVSSNITVTELKKKLQIGADWESAQV